MKVLVKATNWLGDAIMSLPTLRSLKEMKRCSITVLTKRSFADLYRAAPYVDEILPYDRAKGAGRLTGGVKLAGSLKKHGRGIDRRLRHLIRECRPHACVRRDVRTAIGW